MNSNTLRVRKTTWRGQPAYVICGYDGIHGWPVKVVTRSLESAKRIKAKLANGEQTELADFF